MKQLPLIISALLLTFLINGCTNSNTGHPDWIDHNEIKYPSADYLTAVGEGLNRTNSGKNALTNLIETFSVSVRAETKVLNEVIEQTSSLGVTSESSSLFQRNIETEAKQSIQGVEIKESWLSPTGEYYTLAVLSRKVAAKNLTESILMLDEKTVELMRYSNEVAPNAILSVNALRMARDQQLTRSMANLQLKHISGNGLPSKISTQKIEQLIAQRLASLLISVDVSNQQYKKLLQSGLSKLGVTIVKRSPLNIVSVIDASEPALINGWYWLRGSYELTISESGHVISRKRWPLKVSSTDKNLLMPRLQDKLNQNITSYLQELVSDSPKL